MCVLHGGRGQDSHTVVEMKGVDPSAAAVIVGGLMEDHLLPFDLDREQLGFICQGAVFLRRAAT